MPVILTQETLKECLPRAPKAVIDAFVEKQAVLDMAGITHTRMRLTVALAQVEHETNGFTIQNLTENINYTTVQAAKVWPTRFRGGAASVQVKYGTAKSWQVKMMDDVYGNRMGNRPGTHDGSLFIGHGGPQFTGRDGHEALAKYLKLLVPEVGNLTAEQAISYATDHKMQPEVLAAFWMWKNLNPVVDAGGLRAATKPWNGGYIGMADREARMRGNDPIIMRMKLAERALPVTKTMEGGPATPLPPKEVVDATTVNERKTRAAGVGVGAAGGANEGAKVATTAATKPAETQAGTEQPAAPAPSIPLFPAEVGYALLAVGAVVVIVCTIKIARKKAAVVANWF